MTKALRIGMMLATLGGVSGCAVYEPAGRVVVRPGPAYFAPGFVPGHYNGWGRWIPGHYV